MLTRRRAVSLPITAALILLAALALTTTRGANAGFERVPAGVVEANRQLTTRLQPGDKVGSLQYYGLLGDRDVRILRAEIFNEGSCAVDPVPCIQKSRPRFVVVSRTEDQYGVLKLGKAKGWTGPVVDALLADGGYRRVFGNPDVALLEKQAQS